MEKKLILRDLLVEKGPIRIYDIKFSKNENNRHFFKKNIIFVNYQMKKNKIGDG